MKVQLTRWRLLILSALLAGFVSAGVSGCLQTEGQRRAELRERANEILPAGARIRAFDYGDCVELAASPSCARLVFELPERDSGRRAHEVRLAAKAEGWTITRSGNAEGGWNVFLKRGGYSAFVVLWRPAARPISDPQGHIPGRPSLAWSSSGQVAATDDGDARRAA